PRELPVMPTAPPRAPALVVPVVAGEPVVPDVTTVPETAVVREAASAVCSSIDNGAVTPVRITLLRPVVPPTMPPLSRVPVAVEVALGPRGTWPPGPNGTPPPGWDTTPGSEDPGPCGMPGSPYAGGAKGLPPEPPGAEPPGSWPGLSWVPVPGPAGC